MNPTPFVIPKAAWHTMLDKHKPGWRRLWYVKLLGDMAAPRAYVMEKPDRIYVREDALHDARLMRHEWLHLQTRNMGHPSLGSLTYWIDVTGYGLRIVDKHPGKEEFNAWYKKTLRRYSSLY